MDTIVAIISVLVIICLMGTMLYVTRAIKAQRSNKQEEKRKNMTKAAIFVAFYLVLNVIRLIAINKFL